MTWCGGAASKSLPPLEMEGITGTVIYNFPNIQPILTNENFV